MLRVDSPTLVHPELIDLAEARTEATPVPDRYGTYWMPATQKMAPSRDFASAAGAMTLIQDRQALLEATRDRREAPVSRPSTFAPWSDVVREMTHDAKSLVFLLLIIVAGLAVMAWIFTVNAADATGYTIVPRTPVSSVSHPVQASRVPVRPSQRHRKTVAPVPSPSRTQPHIVPVRPSPAHSEAPVPQPVPTPRHTYTFSPDPKPTKTIRPTHTQEPTPTHTPDPVPTVEPTTRTSEPVHTPEPTHEPVHSVTPGS